MRNLIIALMILSNSLIFAQIGNYSAKVYTYSNNIRSQMVFGWEESYNQNGKILMLSYPTYKTKEGFIPNTRYFYDDTLPILILSSIEPNDSDKVEFSYDSKGKCIKQITSYYKNYQVDKKQLKSSPSIKEDSLRMWRKAYGFYYKYDNKGRQILKIKKNFLLNGKVETYKRYFYYDSVNRIIEEKEYNSTRLQEVRKYIYNDSGYIEKVYYDFGWTEKRRESYEVLMKHARLSTKLYYTKKYENTILEIRSNESGTEKFIITKIYDEKGRISEIIQPNYGRVYIYD